MIIDRDAIMKTLGKCRHRNDAAHHYDVMRGGLVWDDEFPPSNNDPWQHLRVIQILAPVFAYRASLTLGEPDKKHEENWIGLMSNFPDWPGFREERIYGDVERELRAHTRLAKKCLGNFEESLAAEDS